MTIRSHHTDSPAEFFWCDPRMIVYSAGRSGRRTTCLEYSWVQMLLVVPGCIVTDRSYILWDDRVRLFKNLMGVAVLVERRCGEKNHKSSRD
jgi:hypothetical protein